MLMNLEVERVKRRLTRRQVSQELCISAQSYNAYVRERRPVPSTVLLRMAELYHCSVDYLLQRSAI